MLVFNNGEAMLLCCHCIASGLIIPPQAVTIFKGDALCEEHVKVYILNK